MRCREGSFFLYVVAHFLVNFIFGCECYNLRRWFIPWPYDSIRISASRALHEIVSFSVYCLFVRYAMLCNMKVKTIFIAMLLLRTSSASNFHKIVVMHETLRQNIQSKLQFTHFIITLRNYEKVFVQNWMMSWNLAILRKCEFRTLFKRTC